jgi:tetratricopeptide (TPR) repeat protein
MNPPGALDRFIAQTQLDFEVHFFGGVLRRLPEYADVLRVHGNNLTLQGRLAEGIEVDRKLIALKPHDPVAHYNLACSYALLKQSDLAVKTLRRAVELGYRDFRYMLEDHDLDSVREDPRFRDLMLEFEAK